MFEKLELTRMAQSLSAHAGARLSVVAANVAHADSPDYKARDLPTFADSYSGGEAMRATRTGHLGAPEVTATPAQAEILRSAASPNGNSVSLETEMVRGVEVRQQHEMALAIYRSTSEIVRTSLGRRG